MAATPVEIFFDPSCPFTWRTSRWLTEVAGTGAATVTWRPMSLAILNEGKDLPEELATMMQQGQRALRAIAAANRAGGSDAVARLYTALGTRRHVQDEPYTDDVIAAAVAESGLPDDVARAVDDTTLDDDVRASHEEAQAAVGQESGTPVLRIGSQAWFGPVVVPPPTGAEALRLFEALRLLAEVPSFSELKTSRAPL